MRCDADRGLNHTSGYRPLGLGTGVPDMAHHKRKKAKHQRAGCLMCKPHKDERGKNGKRGAEGKLPLLKDLSGPSLFDVCSGKIR